MKKTTLLVMALLFSVMAMCQQPAKQAVDSSRIPIISEFDLNQFYMAIQKMPHDEYLKMKEDPSAVLNTLISWKREMIKQEKQAKPQSGQNR